MFFSSVIRCSRIIVHNDREGIHCAFSHIYFLSNPKFLNFKYHFFKNIRLINILRPTKRQKLSVIGQLELVPVSTDRIDELALMPCALMYELRLDVYELRLMCPS